MHQRRVSPSELSLAPYRGAVHWWPGEEHVQQLAQVNSIQRRIQGLSSIYGLEWTTP